MSEISAQPIKGYELLDLIGEGAYGAVYRAHQPVVDREVAIKIILPEYASQPDFIRRFESEAQLVAQLEHLHIVPLYDYWRNPEGAYLVMRLMKGGSLEEVIQTGPLPLAKVSHILEQVVSALAAAHRRGIVHRDIKPANILLDDEGNAYLSDFGIAKALDEGAGLTMTGVIVGTPAYITPEQAQSLAVSPQTDIYALGVVLYAMLIGKHPFPEASPGDLIARHLRDPLPQLGEIDPSLPPSLDAVIQRATAKNPTERYPDVAELLFEFRAAVGPKLAPAITRPLGEELLAIYNPYKGLRAFQEADAEDFFGRHELTDLLLSRLSEKINFSRFLAVVGPSGSGKSSLVRAGLLPALRQGALPGSQNWFIITMNPGAHPLDELEVGLLRIASEKLPGLIDQLQRDKRGFMRASKLVLPDEGTQLLLLVDQFEEIFTLVQDESQARHFMELIYQAVSDPNSQVRVIITLRADFYDRPLMEPEFSSLVQKRTEVVVPLNSAELERAICGPAERFGITFEPGLEAEIMADVHNQPGSLPLMQYALTELFEKRKGHLLTRKAYQSIGGVLGALGKRAEEVYQSLNDTGQAFSRQVFLRLIALGEGVEDTRRRVLRTELTSMADLPSSTTNSVNGGREMVDNVLETFGMARLLSFDHQPITRYPTVEVAHEALLREWRRLKDWLAESRADIRLQRVLNNNATEWLAANRDPSFVMRGSRLDQFEDWSQTTGISLTFDERAYLDTCLEAHRLQQAEEAARQQREAALEKRSRLFLRALVLVFALAALVAVILSVYAFNQANVATSRELANAAINNLEVDPERSVLLALQGLESAYTLEAENALHASIMDMHLLETLEGHTELVQSVSISPNGDRVGGVGLYGKVIIWDAITGQELLRFQSHDEHAFSITFSPDGLQIATASEDGTARIWDASNGEELIILQGHGGAVNAVAFSPDGKSIATASEDTTVRVWDAASGEVVSSFSGHEPAPRSASLHPGGVIDVAFNHDGTQLASGGADGVAILWDVVSGEKLLTIRDQHSNETFVAFHPDGTQLATAGTEGLIKFWDITSGELPHVPSLSINHEQATRSLAFSLDGTRIAAASQDGLARVWDTKSGQRIVQLVGHSGLIDDLAFSPQGNWLITGGEDKTVKVWDLSPGHEWFTVPGGVPFYTPDGSQLATDFNGITLRDSQSGQELNTLPITHDPFINQAVYNPKGNQIATASWDGTAKVWNATNGQELLTLAGHTDRVWEVLFSPDGTHLVTGSHDGTAKIWDAHSGKELFTLSGHGGPIQGIAISNDGKRIATGSWDDSAKLWDIGTGQELLTLHADGDLTDVAFSPDGDLLAAGGNNATVTIWDLSKGDGVKLFTLIGHTGLIPRLAFSPDGKYLASASFDGTTKLWDVSTGTEWLTLSGAYDSLTDVFFNPDGTRLATGGFDGMVRVYALQLEDLIEIAHSRLTRSLNVEECQKFLHRETCP